MEMKWVSLCLLLFSSACTTLLMRSATENVEPADRYSTSTSVVIAELLTLLASFAALAWDGPGFSFSRAAAVLTQSIVHRPTDFAKLAVPAGVYFVLDLTQDFFSPSPAAQASFPPPLVASSRSCHGDAALQL